jgi:cyclic beta-1,2-glucan synthetase
VVGDTTILSAVKYVITLDTDTQLPRDAARQFVGAMAHPLNRPCYDAVKQRVTEGYGILQPRVAISLPGTNRSRYARLYGGEPGIDPYTRVASDVYQDVFGEGSFIGKGIYDVDAFEQALGDRLPENRILSHDLLEGCYARAGLLSDVALYEDYPARYSADVSRRYRWIRGDWQLAGWLLSRVPGQGTGDRAGSRSGRLANPLSALSQWKLIDNLRRSLVPAALTLLLLLGWGLLTSACWWTLSVLGVMLVAPLCTLIVDLVRKPDEVLLRQHFAGVASSARRHLVQFIFALACLPYEAFYSLDAIVRTQWRMLITHRRLLEWNPSIDADREATQRGRSDLARCRSMWIGPAVALAAAIASGRFDTGDVGGSGAGSAPVVRLTWPRLVDQSPAHTPRGGLSGAQVLFLHELSRRTWAFFERFVGEEDHWLPPDNYQLYRGATVAHRTSPTNIGMALLANLSAYDFGYIPTGQLVERTANTLRTLDSLERHRGHFYNWYDTQTLQPLLPLYVSTVDSGNLVGHLLTLRAGLLALADDQILRARLFDGLSDTFRILAATADGVAVAPLEAFAKELESAATGFPGKLAGLRSQLGRLAAGAAEVASQLPVSLQVTDDMEPEGQAHAWAEALVRQCRAALDELTVLAPWLDLPTAPSGLQAELAGLTDLDTIPTCADWRGWTLIWVRVSAPCSTGKRRPATAPGSPICSRRSRPAAPWPEAVWQASNAWYWQPASLRASSMTSCSTRHGDC